MTDPGMDAAISSGVSETNLTGDSTGGTQVADETAREDRWNGLGHKHRITRDLTRLSKKTNQARGKEHILSHSHR